MLRFFTIITGILKNDTFHEGLLGKNLNMVNLVVIDGPVKRVKVG